MRLISLNIWGGVLYEPLMAFVKRESATTDIFCFQEVFDEPSHPGAIAAGAHPGMFRELTSALGDFSDFRVAAEVPWDPENEGMEYHAGGMVTFVRRTIPVLGHGTELYPVGSKVGMARPVHLGLVKILNGAQPIIIVNFHGIVDLASGKRDSEETLRQCRGVIDALNDLPEPKILVGDFNLRPETEAIAMFEQAGYRNLIRENGVQLTRSRTHYPGIEQFKDYVSDYAFISPDIRVNDFRVLPDAVSDHLPLVLEFP